jgi:hypothetical protein
MNPTNGRHATVPDWAGKISRLAPLDQFSEIAASFGWAGTDIIFVNAWTGNTNEAINFGCG